MLKSSVVVLGIFVLLLSISAPVHSAPRGREPLSVRLDGYVGTLPDAATVEVSWKVSLKGEPYKLHVAKLRVLTGNVAYYNIINALKPYSTALTIVGDDDQLDLFATAPAGQKISVTGIMQFAGGARYFMISKVDYVGTPASEATP